MSKLRNVVVMLPTPHEYSRALQECLEVDVDESARLIRLFHAEVILPQVIADDIQTMAENAGWRLSDLYAYFIVQGVMRVVEHGTPIV